MCGDGCIKTVRQVSLAIPAKNKKESRIFRACLIEKSGESPMLAPNGCGAAVDMKNYLKKTGAVIIEQR